MENMNVTIIPGVPCGTPLLRMLFDVPARASNIYRANGVAIVVEGYTIYRFLNGETTTAHAYTITPRAPGTLELLVSAGHAGGVSMSLVPRINTILHIVGVPEQWIDTSARMSDFLNPHTLGTIQLASPRDLFYAEWDGESEPQRHPKDNIRSTLRRKRRGRN